MCRWLGDESLFGLKIRIEKVENYSMKNKINQEEKRNFIGETHPN